MFDLNRRIDALDYVRGFALLGIILVNIFFLLKIKAPAPETADASYLRFLYLFVEGRFYAIFSFLFGVGFYLFISRARAKGRPAYTLFLRRLIALFLFGIIHLLSSNGDALTVYAVCGLLIMPLYKVNRRVNLCAGVLLLIAVVAMSSKTLMPLPLVLLGLAAGQYGVFERLESKLRALSISAVLVVIVAVSALMFHYSYAPATPFGYEIMLMEGQGDPLAHQFINIGIALFPIVSITYVVLLVLALQSTVLRTLLSPLKYYGRAALTNYIGQTAMILIAGHVFDLFGNITLLQSLYLSLAICVIQIGFSYIWLRFFAYGPLEWFWRMLTYWEVPPLVKKRYVQKGKVVH
ncbi:DUF418 domain-containing protein [Paenibacillus elgii]